MSEETHFGLGLRLLALVQIVAFHSLYRDVLAFAGSRGLQPVTEVLAASGRDYGARRFVYFPSVLHLASTDVALRRWVLVGGAASVVAMLGGPASPVAFAIAWVIFLSFDVAIDLLYPWDSLVLEASFLALFAPSLCWLPSLATEHAPHALLVWALRFLAFRVVFGFGKYKFFGPGRLDTAYLKSFLVTQPMPRPLGLRLQRLPTWAHQLALAGVFVVEVMSPWLWLGGATVRWIPSVLVTLLMLGIQLTGNFGYFNLGTVVLAVLAATATRSPLDLSVDRLPLTLDAPTVAALTLLALGLCHLPFHSWVSRSWMYWPDLARRGGRALAPLFAVLRLASKLRLVHAYGVFGPEPGPRGQWVPVFEATRDGQTWLPYRYRFYPTDASFRGVSVSPAFPRFDHALIYDAMGFGLGNLMGAIVGGGHPYRATRLLFLERVQRRLLEASRDVISLFASAPFGDERPVAVRIAFQFLAHEELATQSRYVSIPLGLHAEPRTLDGALWPVAEPIELPHASQFLPDDRVWAERAFVPAPLDRTPPRLDVVQSLSDATDGTLERAIAWGEAHRDEGRAHERRVFATSWTLRRAASPLPGEGEFELWLRSLDAAVRATDAHDLSALRCGEILRAASPGGGLRVLAALRPTWVRFHARKARLRAFTLRGAARPPVSFAPGILRWLSTLADADTTPLHDLERALAPSHGHMLSSHAFNMRARQDDGRAPGGLRLP